MYEVLDNLITDTAEKYPSDEALRHKNRSISYENLEDSVSDFAAGLLELGAGKGDRVAVYSEKSVEAVIAIFGTSRAGCVTVPVNPLLKPSQIVYLLNDCNVRILVTTSARFLELGSSLVDCEALDCVVLTDVETQDSDNASISVMGWKELPGEEGIVRFPRLISSDMAAIMYTSGSTGRPKGVILSHGNMTIGATSVASYLGNSKSDRVLAVLPLSFDAGLSQLTTAFSVGASVILHDHFLPRDTQKLIEKEEITGITGVPPLWMQLADQNWSKGAAASVRYIANTGGKMPRETLQQLRKIFSNAKPFLMYGLTESFRSTYLDPSEVDARPDSIGKAIPNVEVLVATPDGEICAPNEVGELVHRGPLVSLGYWNDSERTHKRFKPSPGQPKGIPITELAVWSGDAVKMDEDGFLYFVSRTDDMIKTSGYRVSPTEIEEIAFDSGIVAEVAAVGVADKRLGHRIVVVAKPRNSCEKNTEELLGRFRSEVPNYMIPSTIYWLDSLPRNANGKLDRIKIRELIDELLENTEQ